MRARKLIFAAAPLLAFAVFAQRHENTIAGTWEGDSICVIRDSPCHDEHVVYEISRNSTQKTPGTSLDWKMDAYKIVSGEKQSMGSLRCSFDEAKKNLSCLTKTRTEVDWEYFLDGDTLHGTLQTGPEKTLFRKVLAKRVHH